MRTINVYETGEEVYIKAVVRGCTVDGGTIKYSLRNTVTGLDDKYLYEAGQIYPCEQSNKKPVEKKEPVKKITRAKTTK